MANCYALRFTRYRLLRSMCALSWALLISGAGALAAGPMSAPDAARSLGGLRDGNRFNAIANMARSGQLHSPLSAADGAAILQGTTQSSRAAAIGELAPLLKADLVGQEAATILGPAETLSEGNRFNAIAALARAKRFGPSIGEDAALALMGSTQSSRAAAIGELAPYLRMGMSGQAIASVLGPAAMLSDDNRFNAIAAITRQTKRPAILVGSDVAAILQGAVQSARAAAIGELAALVKSDLNGQEAEAILGSEAILSEGNRFNAIAALARAKRFGPSIGEDAALALKGATQSSRAAAIGEIAPYLRIELSGQAIATVLGPPAVLTDGNRYNAIAAIARTAKKLATLSSADGEAILQGTTQSSRAAAVGELARFFKADLTGQEAEAILGTEAVLSDGNRYNAIAALARAKRFGPSIGEDAALALKGATQSSRAAAIGEMAPYLRNGMSGHAIAAVLGDASNLGEGNRYNAISALANAGKLGAGLNGDEIAVILQGTTGQTRVSAITLIANAAKQQSGGTSLLIGGAPLPSATAGTTPTTSGGASTPPPANAVQPEDAPFTCGALTNLELRFCNLLADVGERVVIGVGEKAQEIAIRKLYLSLFQRLTPQMQRQLFSGKFLGAKFFSAAYTPSINKLLQKPKLVSYFDYGIGDAFCDTFKGTFDAWVSATYLTSDQPWKFAFLQSGGDQIFIACSVFIANGNTITTPQARLLEAVLLETTITVEHIESATASWIALRRERQEAVGSIAALMQKSASVTVLREAQLRPPASRSASVGLDFVLASVRDAVGSSDIPRFDEVARIAYEADMARLRAGAVNTAKVSAIVARASKLADQLDSTRGALDKVWITPFGSYAQTTTSLLRMLNLTN